MQPNSGDNLFREWDLYAHIVDANWMRHRDVSAGLTAALSSTRCDRASRVLDLGCGDGWVAQNVFGDCEIAKYVGVDLSESALRRHAQRPAPGRHAQDVDKELIRGDMVEVIQTMSDTSFDVILASYSLHHLRTEQKERLLDQITRIVTPGGGFFWTDVFRNENEDRDEFLRRLCEEIATQWDSISQEDRDATMSHIWQCDYPERESWMLDQAATRGLAIGRKLFGDQFYGSWWFVKSATSR